MDGGAWWAAVHGVAKSRTRLSKLAASAAAADQWSVAKKSQVWNLGKVLDQGPSFALTGYY